MRAFVDATVFSASCQSLSAMVDQVGWTEATTTLARSLGSAMLECFGHGDYVIHTWERWTLR
jgi:hypothetical protein